MAKKVYDFENDGNINKKTEKRDSNSIRTVKILVWFFAIIIVSSGLFFLYIEYGQFFIGISSGDSFEEFSIEYEDYDDYIFTIGNRYIIQSGKDMLAFYDNNSNIKVVENVDLSTPIVKTNGSHLMVYNKNGKSVITYLEDKIQYSLDVEGDIVVGSINKNGYFGLVMNDETFNSKVGIYNQKGEMLYNFNSVNYVLDVDVKENNRAFSIVTLSDETGKISSGIRNFNILKATEEWAFIVNNVIISDIEYIADTVIAVGDDGIRAFIDGKRVWENLTIDMEFWKYHIGNKYIIMVKTENYGNIVENQNIVEIISFEGSILGTVPIDGVINGVISWNNTICVYKDRSIYIYDSNGKNIVEMYTDLDIKELFLNSDDYITIAYENHMETRKIR